MKCPDCHGHGHFIGVAHYKFVKRPCRLCEATGEVPDETQKWIDIGKRMRADRLKRKENQRVAASRMGLTLKQYNDMERGRISNEHI